MPRRPRKRRKAEPTSNAADQDIQSLERLARWLLVLLIVIAIPRYVDLAWNGLPIWFPLDELQHYDVIDRLSSGEFPNQRELITDYSFQITKEYFGVPDVSSYDGTKESLGVLTVSYESQQPPVYYALLAIPNYLLKSQRVPPPQQIKILRSFDLLFYLGTCLFIILIFDHLAVLVGYPRLFGYFIAAWFFVTGFGFRGYISCDHLSPLVGTISLWLMVLLWRSGRPSYVAWSALGVVLAFLAKYTNGYLLPLWLANTLLFYHRRGRPVIWAVLSHVTPFLLLPLYAGARLWGHGVEGFTQRPEALDFFRTVLTAPAAMEAGLALVEQSLPGRLQQFHPWSALVCLGAIAANLVISGRRVLRGRDQRALPVFLACLLSALIVLGAVILSPRVGAFTFHHHRHYGGYAALWYTATLGAPLLVRSRRWNVALASTGLALLATANDLWY